MQDKGFLPSIPSLIFLSPRSFKTDLATSRFSMYLKKRYSFVLYITKRGKKYICFNIFAVATDKDTSDALKFQQPKESAEMDLEG